MEYLDFTIEVTPGRDSEYAVHVVESPAGETEGPFELEFDPRRLSGDWSLLIGQLGSGARGVRLLGPAGNWDAGVPDLHEISGALFRALFPREVRSLYERSLGLAGDRGLRIKLKLNPHETRVAELFPLPWELVYDAETRDFLSLRRQSPLVRYLEVPKPLASPEVPERLRILAVISNPRGVRPLDLGQERSNLEKVWGGDPRVNLVFLEEASLGALRNALVEGPCHILHYMGHGDFDDATGEGRLIFESPAGDADPVTSEALAVKLSDAAPRLVFLNACQTAAARNDGGRNPFAGVATGLVLGGVPAVLAMQFPISDGAAIAFSRAFYRRLLAGDPLDSAVVEGRQAIHSTDPSTMEWATPVLFTRLEGGPLFEKPSRAGSTPHLWGELLERYLEWLVEETEEIELPALPGKGRRPALPLETVYAELREDDTPFYERARNRVRLEQEARRLENLLGVEDLSPEQRHRVIWREIRLLAGDPVPWSVEERDRPNLFEPRAGNVSLDEALRKYGRLVILGDPGGGKSTLVRWLAQQHARARLAGESRLRVAVDRFHPGAEGGVADLGPAGVPILLRVAAFAKDRKNHPERRLVQFLGHHLGSAYGRVVADRHGEVLDPEALNALFRHLLERGEAVVLLDGLDEVADPTERYEIARETEAFMDAYRPEHRLLTSPVDSNQALSLPADGLAGETGNQVVVTSRIVGYQLGGLEADAHHVTLEPMGPRAVEHFCQRWMEAFHRTGLPAKAWHDKARARSRRAAAALRDGLAQLLERGADGLAGNPLMITVLALLFQKGLESLPSQRIRLYEPAIEVLIEKWRRRVEQLGGKAIDTEVLVEMLVPLAAEIHQKSAIGVIDDDDLRRALEKCLEGDEVERFRRALREEIGILTARGEGVYGFLHLAFQEYLAARWLVADAKAGASRVAGRLGDPRWREPVLMAIGLWSDRLPPDELESLLCGLLRTDGEGILPRFALVLAAALSEMVQVPAGVVQDLTRRILAGYAACEDDLDLPSARLLRKAFRAILSHGDSPVIDAVLREALLAPWREGLGSAAARLCAENRRDSPALAEALALARPRDVEPWPIDRALRDLVSRDPALLPSPRDSLRRTLERKPELAERFLASPAWRRLGILVYGGLEQRTKGSALGEVFSPGRFHHDNPALDKLVVQALTEGRPAESLTEDLRRLLAQAQDSESRRDAALALLSLSELPAGQAALSDSSGLARGEETTALSSALRRLSKTIATASWPTRPLLEALQEISAEDSDLENTEELFLQVLDLVPRDRREPAFVLAAAARAPRPVRPIVLAELWHLLLSGDFLSQAGADPLYNMAVALDTLGRDLGHPPQLLAESLASAGGAPLARAGASAWPVEVLSPTPQNRLDVLTAALDALAAIPPSFDFVRGWALVCLAPPLFEHGLSTEAAILARAGLSDRFDARTHAWGRLLELGRFPPGWSDRPPTSDDLHRAALDVEDPFRRFRACRRLAEFFAELRHPLTVDRLSSHRTFQAAMPAAARAIPEPHRRAWAFEQLALCGHCLGDPLADARDAALEIDDMDVRARTLLRLAVGFPGSGGSSALLKAALASAERIAEPGRRARAFGLLRSWLADDSHLRARFERRVRKLDVVNQARARGRRAPVLLAANKELDAAGVAASCLVSRALVEDELPPRGPQRWNRKTVWTLARRLEAGDTEPVRRLIPGLTDPGPFVRPFARDLCRRPEAWLSHQGHLLSAEIDGVSERTLPVLLDLLATADDRTRYRAALALHGDDSVHRRRWTTSHLGAAVVRQLAGRWLDLQEDEPRLALILRWTFETLEHDDASLIAAAVADAGGKPGRVRAEAEVVLANLHTVRNNAWPAVTSGLRDGCPAARRSLLRSLCLLLARDRVPPATWQDMAAVLRTPLAPPAEGGVAPGDEGYVLDGAAAVVSAAEEAWRGAESQGAAVEVAVRSYERFRRPWSQVFRQNPRAMRSTLAAIGSERLVTARSRSDVVAAADRAAATPPVLELLMDWLGLHLRRDVQQRSYDDYLVIDLLDLVAALAARLPNTYFEKARRLSVWERQLREVVEYADWYPARQAALVLLSYGRRVTRHVLAALRAASGDVPEVWQTALQSIGRYREIEPGLLCVLVADLGSASPARALATARMLAALARNSHFTEETRCGALDALEAAAADEEFRQEVYLLAERPLGRHSKIRRIERVGRLDVLIRQLLVEVAGLADLFF